jgi:hypothetical protein
MSGKEFVLAKYPDAYCHNSSIRNDFVIKTRLYGTYGKIIDLGNRCKYELSAWGSAAKRIREAK